MLTAMLLAATISTYPEDFDTFDKTALVSLALVSIYDVMNTEHCLKRGMCSEVDPFLGGQYPDRFRLYGMFVLSQALVIFTAKVLPRPYRWIFESIVLGAEVGNVIGNTVTFRRIGMSWKNTLSISF